MSFATEVTGFRAAAMRYTWHTAIAASLGVGSSYRSGGEPCYRTGHKTPASHGGWPEHAVCQLQPR